MIENSWHALIDFVIKWSTNPLVALLVGSLVTLFRKHIGHFFSFVLKWFWAIITRRSKDYAFERDYLTWVINRHRYLGLLPARVVAARWGEEGRNVDLEKVYVSLHVSSQGEDQNRSKASGIDPSSWCREPWLYTILRNNLWFGIFLSIPLIFLIICLVLVVFLHYPFTTGLFMILPLLILCILLAFVRWVVLRK